MKGFFLRPEQGIEIARSFEILVGIRSPDLLNGRFEIADGLPEPTDGGLPVVRLDRPLLPWKAPSLERARNRIDGSTVSLLVRRFEGLKGGHGLLPKRGGHEIRMAALARVTIPLLYHLRGQFLGAVRCILKGLVCPLCIVVRIPMSGTAHVSLGDTPQVLHLQPQHLLL